MQLKQECIDMELKQECIDMQLKIARSNSHETVTVRVYIHDNAWFI